ncbi:YihY/virulence factor BrkB family protein [Siccirubricoccus sp. KC 17139]|uniref:YihY/virulence factor BrkB family protein n=1 Tax=Siccirubricoccus soli TaxID=2899147 RepID=A0ABT1D8D9_9PROT|nr:YihY/virulence factor BrkB family protein [Siccirubricoccus soli]MCO6417449.1 YihY/virulence factor BrkB family protein [Siccirubricoccus soli]MCP2683584.1 YihY/virulence factor BrkB family protein [Siccirubricoccus soli]
MKEPKPSPLLLGALAAGGLLLAAFNREARPPAEAARPRRAAPRAEKDAGRSHRARHRHGDRARGGGSHGRDATRPEEIPPRGWWAIAKRTVSQVSDDRVLTEAAGVTFYALLALFPALAALVSLYGLFADPATISEHLGAVGSVVPGGGMEIIEEQVKRITAKGEGTLGFGALIGLATSLWSSNQAMKAIVDALNVVYEEKEKRSFFRRLLVTMTFTLAGILFILLAMAAVVVLPVALAFIGLDGVLETVLRLARWPVLLLAVGLFLACLYRYGPSRERAQWRWVSWGSAFASLAWLVFSLGFSWYVTNFGSYNETYGSLGAVIGFMTWIWLSATVVLVGAELDAEMEHQTARDTTTGPERPMGTRGARMADEVAS